MCLGNNNCSLQPSINGVFQAPQKINKHRFAGEGWQILVLRKELPRPFFSRICGQVILHYEFRSVLPSVTITQTRTPESKPVLPSVTVTQTRTPAECGIFRFLVAKVRKKKDKHHYMHC